LNEARRKLEATLAELDAERRRHAEQELSEQAESQTNNSKLQAALDESRKGFDSNKLLLTETLAAERTRLNTLMANERHQASVDLKRTRKSFDVEQTALQ